MNARKVHYWVKKAEKNDLIKLFNKGVFCDYRLTPKGREYLDYTRVKGSEVFGRVFRLHNFGLKYPLLAEPAVVVDWRKVGLANWTKLVGTVLGVTVEKTTRHLIVYADVIHGSDPWKLLFMAYRECERIAKYLEQSTKMRLGIPDLVRKPHFAVKDEVADQISRYIEVTNDVGKIDQSEGLPGELDLFGPDFAKNYILSRAVMPQQLARFNQQLEILHKGQMTQIQTMKKIEEALIIFATGINELKDIFSGGIKELNGSIEKLVKVRRKKRAKPSKKRRRQRKKEIMHFIRSLEK